MTEGCAFRDRYDQFQALGVNVFGASFDQPAENKAFSSSNSFQYTLLSDLDRVLALHFGAATSQGQFFASRVTAVIDPQGRWRLSYPNVNNTEQHPEDVLTDMTKILAP